MYRNAPANAAGLIRSVMQAARIWQIQPLFVSMSPAAKASALGRCDGGENNEAPNREAVRGSGTVRSGAAPGLLEATCPYAPPGKYGNPFLEVTNWRSVGSTPHRRSCIEIPREPFSLTNLAI
jgi:hypothetical protein